MKKYAKFLAPKVFINQHGSHAKPKKITEGAIPDSDRWHDGTPEGKRHLEMMLEHLHQPGDMNYGGVHADQLERHLHAANYGRFGIPHTGDEFEDERMSLKMHREMAAMHDISHMDKEHHVEVKDYTSGSYNLNKSLVLGEDHFKHEVARLDHAIDGTSSKYHGLVTYTGLKRGISGYLQNGPVIHSKGFVSSSTSNGIASTFGKDVMLLHHPDDHKVYPIASHRTEYPSEQEVLHPRGMLLRPRASVHYSRLHMGEAPPPYTKNSLYSTTIEGIDK